MGEPSLDLRLLTRFSIDLYTARVQADYDLDFRFSHSASQEHVESAAEALTLWRTLATTEEGRAFAIALLHGPALTGRYG